MTAFLDLKQTWATQPKTVRPIVMVFILKLVLKPSIQERSLRAFLDLAIVRVLADRSMTGYEMSGLFVKKFGMPIGPSMIYSKIYSLERKGMIKCIRNRVGRAYSLTEQGHEIVNNIASITEEIQKFTRTMLSS